MDWLLLWDRPAIGENDYQSCLQWVWKLSSKCHHHHHHHHHHSIVIIVIIITSTPAPTSDFTAADSSIGFFNKVLRVTRTLSSCGHSLQFQERVTLSSCVHSLRFQERVVCDPNAIKLRSFIAVPRTCCVWPERYQVAVIHCGSNNVLRVILPQPVRHTYENTMALRLLEVSKGVSKGWKQYSHL